MFSSRRHRIKILNVLICLVLIDKAESSAARTEIKNFQGPINFERQSDGVGPGRAAVDVHKTKKSEASTTRGLLQNTRQFRSQVQSSCAVSSEDVDRFYDAFSGQWVINDEVIEELDSDVQVVVECANEGDVVLFRTDQQVKPKRTLDFSKNLTFASQSGAEDEANGSLASVTRRVRITCPDSGQLLISRSSSFTLRNLVIEYCNTTLSVIEVDSDCIDERPTRRVRLLDVTIERNEVSEQGSIVNLSSARCVHFELNNMLFHRNRCDRPCVLLSRASTLNNITLKRNEGKDISALDSSIFSASNGSEIAALNVTSEKNEIRSFYLVNGTLSIADSYFGNNARQQSEVTRDNSIGGGVLFSNHSFILITRTIFEHNYALNGGGVYAWYSNISVSECLFHENDAGEGHGGALYGHYNSSFDITFTTFSKNRGYFGASLHSNYSIRVNMVNVNVSENNSSRSEGVWLSNGDGSVRSSVFFQNTAIRAAGALVADSIKLTIKNSTFVRNDAGFGGACVFQYNSTVRASALRFEHNSARDIDGGAVYFSFEGRMTIRDSVFLDNDTPRYGGAIYTTGESETFLKRVVFENNTSSEYGGAALIRNGNFSASDLSFTGNSASSYAGAISFHETNTVSLSNSRFEANSAPIAGAVHLFSVTSGLIEQCTFVKNSGVESRGGSVYASESNVDILSSLFQENTASSGGALSLVTRCNCTILNSSFEDNVAERVGGAISLTSSSSLELFNSSFLGNRASWGGAVSVNSQCNASLSRVEFVENYATFGGCLDLDEFSKVEVANSLFSNNAAESRGGAIHLQDHSEFSISNSLLAGNNGGYFGGGVQVSSNSTIEFIAVIFEKNGARFGGALHMLDSCNATVSSCSFTDNRGFNSGGAILLDNNCSLFLNNSTLSGNRAQFGGGLYVNSNSTAVLLYNVFARNRASSSGGAVYLQTSNMLALIIQWAFNSATFGGSLAVFISSLEIINSTITGSYVARSGGAIALVETNATLETVHLESNAAREDGGGIYAIDASNINASNLVVFSNFAGDVGGGISLHNASLLVCDSCTISQNRAFSGAGMYAFSTDSTEVVALLYNSRFKNNSARSYGGGIEFATPQNRSINCSNPRVTCGHIILVNTRFIDNYATHSGAIVLTTDPRRVLIDCDYRGGRNQEFLSGTELNSFGVIDPTRLCTSWRRNRVSSNAYGDVVGTYGQEIVLTIDPEDEVRIVGSTKSGYVLENVSSGRQLPTINVTILDGYGVGPAPTLPHSFEARLSSPDGLFTGLYPTTIAAGVGNFSRVIGLVIPGNYTIEFVFDNEAFEAFNVTAIVRECLAGEESTRDKLTCQECDAFSYNFNASQGGCKECPSEATCEGRYIVPRNGHWHKSPCHDTVQECLIEEACTYEGRDDALLNFTQNSTDCNINKTTMDSYNDELCNEGYKGPLCGSCKKSFGLSVRYLCLKCASTFLSLLTIVGIALYLLGASSLTIRGCLPSNLQPQDCQPGPSQSANASETSYQDPEINVEMVKMIVEGHVPREYFQKKQEASTSQVAETQSNQRETEHELTKWKITEIFKITLNFLQTIAVAATINVKWTGGMLALFEGSEYVGALSTVAVSRPVDCITSSSSAVTKAVWRILVSLFVPGIVVSIFASIWGCIAFKKKKRCSYFMKRFTLSVIAVTYISYLGLTKMAVRAFYCVGIYDANDPSSKTKENFWAVDTAIRCYGKDHYEVVTIAVIVICVVTMCFPLVSAIVLSCNKEGHRKRDSWVFETSGFLFRVFKEGLVFWESVVMFRKACLSVIVVFSYPLGGDIQGILASVLLLFCLYLQLTLRPYRKEFKRLNHLESISLLVSAVTFNLSLFFVSDRCSDLVRTSVAAGIVLGNCTFFVYLLFAFSCSSISHLRVALKCDNIPLPDNAPWWRVLKIYIKSRSCGGSHRKT